MTNSIIQTADYNSQFSKRKDNFIYIERSVMEHALALPDSPLEGIANKAYNTRMQNDIRGWGDDNNIYIGIKGIIGSSNSKTEGVIFHVKDGYCVIIPKYLELFDESRVDCHELYDEIGGDLGLTGDYSGRFMQNCKKVNLIDIMLRKKFCINSENVIGNFDGKVRRLYRQIMALVYYRNFDYSISEILDVHHKDRRYLLLQENMVLMGKQKHGRLGGDSHKSHRWGCCIKDLDGLEELLLWLKYKTPKLEEKEF